MSANANLIKRIKELEVSNQILLEKIAIFNRSIYSNLNLYNKENTNYITDGVYIKLLKYPTLGMIELFKLIHYDDKYTDNRNILIDDLDDSTVHIYHGDKWKPVNLDEILYTIILRLFKLMDEHYQKGPIKRDDEESLAIKDKFERLRYRVKHKDKNFIEFCGEEVRIAMYRAKLKYKK